MQKSKKVLILYLVFVFLSNFSLLTQFLSSFLTNSNLDLLTISSLYLTFQITKFIFEVPTGYIADKYGRKASAILGIILLLLSYFIFLSKESYLFYISFFIKGIAITLLSGSIESIYVENVEEDKLVKYNTIERLVFFGSFSLAALLGGYLIDIFSYTHIIIFDIIVSFAVILVILPFKEERHTSESLKNRVSAKECFKYILEKKVLSYLYLIDFASAFSFVAIENLYPAYLEQIGVKINLIGIFLSIQLLFSAFVGLFISKVRARISDKILLYFLPILNVLLLMPIYLFKIPIILIPILFTLKYIVFVLYAPIKYSLFQKSIPNKYRATLISLSSQFIAFGAIGFYSFSSILSFNFSINFIISAALSITLILVIFSCYKLNKIKALD